MKKYLCLRDDKVEAEWLPRWYGVPFDECEFVHSSYDQYPSGWFDGTPLIILKPRLDNNYDIKIAKTEHLLNGG